MQKENKVSKLTRFLILVPILLILVIVSAIIINKNSSIVDIAKTGELEVKTYVTSTDNKWWYTVTDENNKTIKLERYLSTSAEVNIPSTIDGYTVTSLNTLILWGDRNIYNITIPSTIINVKDGNSYDSSVLQSITVDSNNPNYTSENGVLYNKNKTQLIRCPEKKTSVSIPSSVTSIEDMAFWRCESLTNIEIPSSVTNIKHGAFENCKGLTSINIPSSVTDIGSMAFSGCRGLTSINIPSSITRITDYTFRYCSNLTSVEIPSSVKRIDNAAFGNCTNLTSIKIPASVTQISDNVFEGDTNLTIIGYPDTKAHSYAEENSIKFEKIAISSMVIKTNPKKLSYVQSFENLSLSGGELEITFADNYKTTRKMTESGVTASGFTNSTPGTIPITISYEGKSTTLNVTIVAKTLSEISIKTNPTKTNYVQGLENLDLSGGELTLTYNNNNNWKETVSMKETGVTTSGFSNSTVGTVPVTITYGGKSTTLNVTILAKTLSGISIKTNPTKMNYIQSFENLDLAGGELTLTYNNNNNWKETVSMRETGVTTSGFSNSTVGTVPVTITYGGKNTTLNITILAKTLSGISIKTNPTKMSYKQNIENLDLTGGELTLTYNSNNNWTETISMKEAGVTTSGFNNSTPGTVPVTITYGGKSTTLNVTVTEKVLTGISIKTKPAKTSYKKDNEDLDLTGGIITLKYDDNTTEDIAMTSTQVEVTGFSNTTLGKKVLTVKYGNKSTTYEIEIICNINYEPTPDGEGIIITGGDKDNPNIVIPEEINGKPVTDIGSGAFKDRDDLESIEIPDSVINIADDAFDGSEDTIIICNPGSAAEEFAKDHDMSYIYKDKIITGISVKTNPIKMNYMKELENLDLTGGRLTVKYEEEGLTSVLRMTSKGVTATGFDNTEIGQNTITVSYDGKSTTFEVTIEEKPSILLGDISGDGVVDSTDLLLMKRHIIAGTKTEWILTGNEFTRGDMNSDGTIDSTDLLLLKRKIINE